MLSDHAEDFLWKIEPKICLATNLEKVYLENLNDNKRIYQ